MPRILLFLPFVFAALSTHAQRLREDSWLTSLKPATAMRPMQPVTPQQRTRQVLPIRVATPDTLYAAATTMTDGWITPMIIVTRQAARSMDTVFRFTRRNTAGHWLQVDCLDGLGQPNSENFSAYIHKGNDNDATGQDDWGTNISSVTTVRYVTDASGQRMLQERNYNAEGALVYTYTPTSLDAHTEVGVYADAIGLPAEMRDKLAYSQVYASRTAPLLGLNDSVCPPLAYGTLARVSTDRRGHVARVSFMDSRGQFMANYDHAASFNSLTNARGDILSHWSADTAGQRINDGCGNCGLVITYDAQGRKSSITCLGADGQPMRYPASNAEGLTDGMIRIHYDYDKLGRTIGYRLTDASNRPMENAHGVAQRRCRYNDRGQVLAQADYDLKGNLRPSDPSGTARYVFTYDALGRQTDVSFLDSLNRPVAKEGYLCGSHTEYAPDGSVSLQQQFSMKDGKKHISYEERKGKDWQRTTFDDGQVRIDSTDSRGRTTFYGLYDAEGNLVDNSDGYACQTISYRDTPGHCHIQRTNFDQYRNNTYAYGYVTRHTVDDSLACTTDFRNEAFAGPRQAFRQHYSSPELSTITGQSNLDAFFTPCHGAGSNNFSYYGLNITHPSDDSQLSSIIGYDEWGELSYINELTGLRRIYCSLATLPNSEQDACFDEDGQRITDFDRLRDSLPKLLTVEITDTTKAYQTGLRSNDIILQYAQFSQPNAILSDEDFLSLWGSAACFATPENKNMLVLRPHPEVGRFSLHNFELNEGTIKELGLRAHVLHATRRQWQRVWQAVDSLRGKGDIDDMGNMAHMDETLSLSNVGDLEPFRHDSAMVMMMPSGSMEQNGTYFSYFIDAPVILFEARLTVESSEDKPFSVTDWTPAMPIDSLRHIVEKCNFEDGTSLTIWYSADGQKVDSLDIPSSLFTPVVYAPVSHPDRFARLSRLYRMWKRPSPADYQLRQADQATLEAVYQEAELLRRKQVGEVPARMFHALADAGYTDAYSYLVEHYLGLSVDSIAPTRANLSRANHWNRRAVKAGDDFGLLLLAQHQTQQGDTLRAIRTLETITSRNSDYAQRAYKNLSELHLCRRDTAKYLSALAKYALYITDEEELQNTFMTASDLLHNDSTVTGEDSLWADYPKETAQVMTACAVRLRHVFSENDLAYSIFTLTRLLGQGLKVDGQDYTLSECFALIDAQKEAEDDSFEQKFVSYLNNKLFRLSYDKSNPVARRHHLRGAYYLMQIEDLEMTSLENFTQWCDRPLGRQAYIYLCDEEGHTVRIPFSDDALKDCTVPNVTPEHRLLLTRAFQLWKQEHPDQFVPYVEAE